MITPSAVVSQVPTESSYHWAATEFGIRAACRGGRPGAITAPGGVLGHALFLGLRVRVAAGFFASDLASVGAPSAAFPHRRAGALSAAGCRVFLAAVTLACNAAIRSTTSAFPPATAGLVVSLPLIFAWISASSASR